MKRSILGGIDCAAEFFPVWWWPPTLPPPLWSWPPTEPPLWSWPPTEPPLWSWPPTEPPVWVEPPIFPPVWLEPPGFPPVWLEPPVLPPCQSKLGLPKHQIEKLFISSNFLKKRILPPSLFNILFCTWNRRLLGQNERQNQQNHYQLHVLKTYTTLAWNLFHTSCLVIADSIYKISVQSCLYQL